MRWHGRDDSTPARHPAGAAVGWKSLGRRPAFGRQFFGASPGYASSAGERWARPPRVTSGPPGARGWSVAGPARPAPTARTPWPGSAARDRDAWHALRIHLSGTGQRRRVVWPREVVLSGRPVGQDTVGGPAA